ncbi:hypothetical protein [Gilliamella sp. W8128]|uniref:hypothetical protein n=1 Tax=Gilliamella sp. W8128 TaxID=2751010 RepID=UPI0018DC43F7|nr:hypothetical protein [Gilliamella sp. W8128]MBI0154115.1 HK97 gp10 family phage protein [Gilliamella sp. W8128]
MSNNSTNFLQSINAFVDKAKANSELIVKKGCINVLQDIIRMSPVGQPAIWKSKPPKNYSGGLFRGNWQISFDIPVTNAIDRIDPTGMDTLKDGIEQIGRYTYGVKSVYFTNNLPYSVRLEFGHSKQAPNGIVRIAALNTQAHFDNAAKGG